MAVLELPRPVASRPLAIPFASTLAPLATLAVSYVLLFSARGWLPFVDESDNFLGGYLIAHGQVLYRDYFSHHMPLPYYLAALPARLGVSSMTGFRVFTSLLILGVWAFVLFRFRGRIAPAVLSVLVLTIGIGFPWFAGNMLLAETVESYGLLVLVLYCFAFPDLDWGPADQAVVALAVFAALASNLMSVYPLAVLGAYYVYRKATARRRLDLVGLAGGEARLALFVVAPFALLLGVLLATRTLGAFVQDAFVFNQVYYSKYALAGDPARIAGTILSSDYHYVRLNLGPLAWPTVEGFLLLANVLAGVVLLRRRGLAFALAYAAVAATSRGRGVNFHDQAYYLISFFSVATIVVASWNVLAAGSGRTRRSAPTSGNGQGAALPVDRRGGPACPPAPGEVVTPAERWKRLAQRWGMRLGAGLFLLLAALFYDNLASMYPWHYAAQLPSDAERAIEAATRPGDTVWVVPDGFSLYLDTDRRPASRYAFFLPWLADSPSIDAGIARDLAASRPPVIIFPQHLVFYRTERDVVERIDLDQYGQALRAQLARDYVAADENDPRLQGVLLRRDRADELRQRLRLAGL